jgi:5-methylcytosine-specific restriction endonuclease McrA
MAHANLEERRKHIMELVEQGTPKKELFVLMANKFGCLRSTVYSDLTFLNNYELPKSCQSAKGIKLRVLQRDNFTCQYCGTNNRKNNYCVEHVIPKKLGGEDMEHNLVCACFYCNVNKGRTIWIPRNFAAITVNNLEYKEYVINNAVKDFRD